MKINGMFYGDNSIKMMSSGKPSGSVSEKKSERTDSLTLSGETGGKTDSVMLSADIDYTPRLELINATRNRVENGTYDSSLREAVAEKVADSPAVQDIVSEVAMNRGAETSERTDMVDRIREQVAGGYYDDPEIRRVTAERLMDVLGLSGYQGNN